MKHSLVVAIAIAIAIAIASQLATADAHAQQKDTVVLAGVVISATKAPLSTTALTQSVTVISGEELRARGITSVAEALRAVPGAAVVSSGSFGSLTSLFLRGGESRYTKFLVDGVPVNAVGGSFDLSHLTTDNVERIEVVRGPGSVVHGADAVAGVVHVITRRGAGPTMGQAQLKGGSYGTRSIDAGVSGASGNTGYSVHGARHRTDGILPFNNEYLNGTVSGSVNARTDERTTFALSARATHAVFHYPTDFVGNVVDSNAYRDQRRLTVSAEAARTLRPGLDVRLLGGTNDVTDFTDDVTAGSPGDTRSRYTSRNSRRRVESRATIAVPRGALTAGLEYQRERERTRSESGLAEGTLVESSRFTGSRVTRTAYAEYLGSFRNLTVDVSGRLDDPSDSDRAWTHRLGSAVRLGSSSRVRGTLGTSFNAPAFFYLLDTEYTNGNSSLQPERGRSAELAIDQKVLRGAATITAVYFHQRFGQLIEYVPAGPPDFKGTYANLTAARSRGYELLLATARYKGWAGNLSYTGLKAEVSELPAGYGGTARVGDALLRRPRASAVAGIDFGAPVGASFALSGRYLGARPDLDFRSFPSEPVTLPATTTLNFAAGIPLLGADGRPAVELTLRLDNLFDKRYQEVFNYDAPGRTILVGGRISAPLTR